MEQREALVGTSLVHWTRWKVEKPACPGEVLPLAGKAQGHIEDGALE